MDKNPEVENFGDGKNAVGDGSTFFYNCPKQEYFDWDALYWDRGSVNN